jgi:3-methylfumaryl-CoA hydratase
VSDWSAWVGRHETRQDRVDPGLLARWLATLDRAAPADGLVPHGLHWCLCLPEAATASLGADGHPRRDAAPDGFLPPVPLPRRMWAASELAFEAPLRVGDAVTRRSTILSVTAKTGSSGPLVFVEVAHETHGPAGLAIREQQSIVYREAALPGAPVPAPAPGSGFDVGAWAVHRQIVPSEALLFRFSALTFNSHRIHYDLPYATAMEGYRGLVVHGPLTATMLLDLARRHLGENKLATFGFRGLSPAICGEPLHLVMRDDGDALVLAAFAADGREVMRARAARA